MLSVQELILKKKRGIGLTEEEIQFLIEGYTCGDIPDYQMSALLMAICFVGMSAEETKNLTLAMAHSGEVLDLSAIEGIKVDKHSTGGVGDKTSLILGSMVASLGIPVAKMSGRGLGYTGGTIDKLESISGFTTELSEQQFIKNVNSIHMAIAGQTKALAPADKKLYALRDVTATVDQLSLIAASIMSKKLASGADAIVLDVKAGNGAFMKTLEEAKTLAEEMVSIGTLAGKYVVAVISDMDQPLGNAVGNALEIKEVVDTLQGEGPEDVTELALTLGSYMVLAAKRTKTVEEAKALLQETLHNGQAYQTFCKFVEAQNGDVQQIKNPDLLPKASYKESVCLTKAGYITGIDTEEIGKIVGMLGGGREKKEDVIDYGVGICLAKKKGEYVKQKEAVAFIFANNKEKLANARERLQGAYTIEEEKEEPSAIIKKVIMPS